MERDNKKVKHNRKGKKRIREEREVDK